MDKQTTLHQDVDYEEGASFHDYLARQSVHHCYQIIDFKKGNDLYEASTSSHSSQGRPDRR